MNKFTAVIYSRNKESCIPSTIIQRERKPNYFAAVVNYECRKFIRLVTVELKYLFKGTLK